jgi:adenylate cyclase
MDEDTGALSASELAELAGAAEAEVDRMVDLGILVTRDGTGPFRATDVQKVRLARACEQAGLPMDGIASAIRTGRLSFAFMEAAPYRRWALRSGRSYRQVSEEAGVPLDTLCGALESMGFASVAPDDRIREDELEVVPLLQLGLATGVLDRAWAIRTGRAFTEALRQAAKVENDVYHARFELPILESGRDQRETMELASQLGSDFNPLVDRTLMAIFRRQQELAWTEHLVEHVEAALEQEGVLGLPKRVPAMCFLDLVSYTRLTEERGDQAAAELAASLAMLVDRSARERGGAPVKWLGDGVMFHFPQPGQGVIAALDMVESIAAAGLPPAHVGLHAGPVLFQEGDYFGRTVNAASRIADYARPGEVVVSQEVVDAGGATPAYFVEIGPVQLKGLSEALGLFTAKVSADAGRAAG